MSVPGQWGRYVIDVEVRTPLHIGAGDRYLRDYDFIVQQLPGQAPAVRIFDVEAALDMLDDAALQRARSGTIAKALPAALYGRVTRAVLPVHGTRAVGQDIHAFIRDGLGRLYLPGSSLKGAFRSALLDAYAREQPAKVLASVRQLAGGRLGRESAARPLEESVFSAELPNTRPGSDAPNRDINRWLRISDAYPGREPRIVAAEVQVRSTSSRGNQAIPLWVEAAGPGTVFRAPLTLIPSQFSPWKELDDERKRIFGSNILECLKTWGRALADAELDYWRRHDPAVADRFQGIVDKPALAVFPIGFGTGWLSKTIGMHIRNAPGGNELMRQLIHQFRLSRSRAPDPATFPVGHRVIDGPGGPLPMGWVAIVVARPA